MKPKLTQGALTLEGFRVRMFRTIRDSGHVPVFPLTALIGRQRIGKTSLLLALRGIDPQVAEPYSLELDWPRDNRSHRTASHLVCTADFRLGDQARQNLLSHGTIDEATLGLRVGRTYGGTLLVGSWAPGPNSDERPEDDLPIRDNPELRCYFTEHLPRLLYSSSASVLPGTLTKDDLQEISARGEEAGLAALAQIHANAGIVLTPEGIPQKIHLKYKHDRIRLWLERDGKETPVDQLSLAARYRLTLDLRLAAVQSPERGNSILLLDGPGRAFKKEPAQRLHTVLQQYAAASSTVIYSARLPYDVHVQHSEQVLVMTPASAGPEVRRSGKNSDVRGDIRAALGMIGRSSFRIHDLNLIVEGPTDALILRALDGLLRRSGEAGLPDDLNLASAGGTYEAVTVSDFLAHLNLGVIVLLDSDEAGSEAASRIRAAMHGDSRASRVEVLLLAEAAGLAVETATIEDLFPVPFYLETLRDVSEPDSAAVIADVLANRRWGVESGKKLVSRLTTLLKAKGQKLPKGEVAVALAKKIDTARSIKDLPAEMVEPVRRLMQSIRAATNRHHHPKSARRDRRRRRSGRKRS